MTEHDEGIVKIAVVGEDGWCNIIYAFPAKGFPSAEIEDFRPGELAKAHSWLEADIR